MGVCGRLRACLGRTHATLCIFGPSILLCHTPLPSPAFLDLQSFLMKRIYHKGFWAALGNSPPERSRVHKEEALISSRQRCALSDERPTARIIAH